MTKEKTELKQANSEFEANIQVQTEESAQDKREISKLEARLFHRKAEVERLEKKEDLRKMTEVELVEARKEIVLLGMAIRFVEFSNGGTKLESFLPKNQHTQMIEF